MPAVFASARLADRPQQVAVAPGAAPFRVSGGYRASNVAFTRNPAGMRQVEWHIVPMPMLTVRLTGAVEYEASDGEVRRVAAGEFALVEDAHGKGHLSRQSEDEQTVLWIGLPDGLDAPGNPDPSGLPGPAFMGVSAPDRRTRRAL